MFGKPMLWVSDTIIYENYPYSICILYMFYQVDLSLYFIGIFYVVYQTVRVQMQDWLFS